MGERATDQHYAEFVKTLGFLFGNDVEARKALEDELGRFNASLFSLHDQTEEQLPKLIALRKSIESRLRNIMVRTDRVNATDQRDAMISTVTDPRVIPNTSDIVAYAAEDCSQAGTSRSAGILALCAIPRCEFPEWIRTSGPFGKKMSHADPDFDRLLSVPGVFLSFSTCQVEDCQ